MKRSSLRQLPAMEDSRSGRARMSSASSVSASQAFTAASISAAVMRKPGGLEIKPVEFARCLDQRLRRRAPRRHRRWRGSRLSISAETSRFMARKPANRSAKSALLRSSRTGMVAFRRRLGRSPPCSMARRQIAVNPSACGLSQWRRLRHSGARVSANPESRQFRVRCFASSRNDVGISLRRPILTARHPRRDQRFRDRRRQDRPVRIRGIRRRAGARRPGLNIRTALPPGASPG